MIKNILVPLTGLDGDARVLQAAYLVAESFAANIVCHHVQPDPMQIAVRAALGQFGTTMGNVEFLHAIEKEAIARTGKARSLFEDFSKKHASNGKGVNIVWQEAEGDPVADTIREARYSDLVVLVRAPKNGEFTTDDIAAILVAGGRPVLLVPETPLPTIGATVAIAWKETAEAARAVTAAMPLLARAKRIVAMSADEGAEDTNSDARQAERLVRQLTQHGLAAEPRNVVLGGRSVEEALLKTAHEAGADLLVMGAYSHNRIRELVFGGFTRHILQACDLPVLLLH